MFFYYTIVFLLMLSAIFIFLTNNPVYAVFSLILAFIFSAIILIIMNIDFVALLFIMVYVGAVAVLFLFVIMMIDTKSIAKRMVAKQVIMQPMLWLSLLASILWVCYMTDFSNTFFNIDESNLFNDIKNYSPELYNYITSNNQLANTMPESNVNIIAQTLFNGFGRYILYAGILLLVALIGSISLTIDLKPVRVKQERNTIRSMLSGIKLFR